MNDKKRAWIYTRVASPENADELLNGQKEKLQEYAKQKELQVVGESQDVGSGLRFDREGLQAVLKAADAGEMDVLLVFRITRIGRDINETADFIDMLNQLGVKVYCPPDGEVLTLSVDELLASLDAVAQKEGNELGYEYLVGNVFHGTKPTDLHTSQLIKPTASNIASFIVRNATLDSLVMITTPWDTPFLSTIGPFIDRCVDQEFLVKELLPVLIPMQRGEKEPPELELVPEDEPSEEANNPLTLE